MLAVFAVAASAANAQTRMGSRVTGGATSGCFADSHVHETWGPPDSVRLAAAVFWRGQPGWAESHGQAQADSVRRLIDSARASANRRRVTGAGVITPRADAWAEYNDQRRELTVAGQTYRLPGRDSTLVLLVDRVDRVGGEPTVTSRIILHPAYADTIRRMARTDPGAIAKAWDQLRTRWHAVLRADSTVRAFLEPSSQSGADHALCS